MSANDNSNNNSQDNDKLPWWAWLWAGPWAILGLLLYRPAKWLGTKVYDGWDGGFRAFLGVVFGLSGAIATGHYLGWTQGHHWYTWLPAALGAWLGVFFYAWPVLWLFPVKPAWDIGEALYKGFGKFVRQRFETLCRDWVLQIIRIICVGSNKLWNPVLAKADNHWFADLLEWAAYASAALGTYKVSNHVYDVVKLSLAGITGVSFIVAISAWILCLAVIGGAAWQLIKYGKVPFIALVSSGLATYAASGHVTTYGLSTAWTIAAHAGIFLVSAGYVFPALCLALGRGFWKRLWDNVIDPLAEKCYGDKNESFTKFFHHATNLATTAAVAWGATLVCHAFALPTVATVLVTAVCAVLSYVFVFKAIDHVAGNALTGIALGGVPAAYVGYHFWHAGSTLGIAGGVLSGMLTFAALCFFVFPVLYIGVKSVSEAIGVTKLGFVLAAIYGKFDELYKMVYNKLKMFYDTCYKDKSSDYRKLVLHVANIWVAIAMYSLAGSAAAWLGLGVTATSVLTVLSPVLSYLLIGKTLLFKDGYGLNIVATIVGMFAAAYVGTQVFSLDPNARLKAAAITAGFAAWCATYLVGFPVAYVVTDALLGWAGAFAEILEGLFDLAWKPFNGIWNVIVTAYHILARAFAPVWAAVNRLFAPVARAYHKILKWISRG